MILETAIQKPWYIPRHSEQKFRPLLLRQILQSFNRASGGSYFFADYYRRALIVDSSDTRVMCGWPMELAQREGLAFFERILPADEVRRQRLLLAPVSEVFFGLDEEARRNLMLLYDVPVRPAGDVPLRMVHYKVVPFRLCHNGNLWLALGCVSSAIAREPGSRVCLVNMPALMRYDWDGSRFAPSRIRPLTAGELELLELLVKNMLESEVCGLLQVNKYRYHRLKTALFEKLEVDTPAGAVQRAHHLGLI